MWFLRSFMFLVLLMYCCIAGAFTVGKTALGYSDPAFLIGVRMIISGVIMLGYLYFFNKRELKISKKDWRSFLHFAFVGIFLSYLLEFWAMKHGVSSIKASLFFNLSPFITALIAYFTLNEKLSRRQWFGLAIGFLGVAPILFTGERAEQIAGNFGVVSLADLALLLSVPGIFAHNWIILKQLINAGYKPPLINGVSMLGGGLFALIGSFFIERFPPVIILPTDQQGSALYLALSSYIHAPYAAIVIFGLCIVYLVLVTIFLPIICMAIYLIPIQQHFYHLLDLPFLFLQEFLDGSLGVKK